MPHTRGTRRALFPVCGDTLFSLAHQAASSSRKIYLDRPDDDGAPEADLHVAQNAAS